MAAGKFAIQKAPNWKNMFFKLFFLWKIKLSFNFAPKNSSPYWKNHVTCQGLVVGKYIGKNLLLI